MKSYVGGVVEDMLEIQLGQWRPSNSPSFWGGSCPKIRPIRSTYFCDDKRHQDTSQSTHTAHAHHAADYDVKS